MQELHSRRDELKDQAIAVLFAKLDAPKEPKQAVPATKKLRLNFSSGDADEVHSPLEDHVFSRVTAPPSIRREIIITDVEDGHENFCHVCGEVGELLICDKQGCTLSFHLNCAGLDDVPDGDWFCDSCSATCAVAQNANPIDSLDGHHIYCVECGQPGDLIMCDADACPRSYHFSCVGLSKDAPPTGDWICPLHPSEHPASTLHRVLSWELELRQVAVSDPKIQHKLQEFLRGLSKMHQAKAVTELKNSPYDPSCMTGCFLKELLHAISIHIPHSPHCPDSSLPAGPSALAVLDLASHRRNVGFHVRVDVTGRSDGTVYGSSVYSDDSCLHTAAVHFGIVRVGESKTVMLTTRGPQNRFMGSNRNGVKTFSFSAWPGSFSFIQ